MNRTFVAAALCLAIPARLGAQRVDEKTAVEICARFASFKPGPDARPTEADRKLAAADSLAPGSYFVELCKGRKEYDETRRYCLAKGHCDRDLAMIFANGWGVKRDYDAATFFLCRTEDIAAHELWSMLGHIETMRKAEKPADLLYCDHVVSGAGQLYCEQVATARKEEEWTGRIAKVKQVLSAEAAAALEGLMKALEAFAEADAGLWAFGNQGGTGYLASAVEEQNRVHEEQASAVERLASSRAPACTADGLKRADADLNKAYRLARATPLECTMCSDPDVAGVETLTEAQRAWIRYRDAWTVFYVARWKGKSKPKALKREIVFALTTERARQLRGIYLAGEEKEPK